MKNKSTKIRLVCLTSVMHSRSTVCSINYLKRISTEYNTVQYNSILFYYLSMQQWIIFSKCIRAHFAWNHQKIVLFFPPAAWRLSKLIEKLVRIKSLTRQPPFGSIWEKNKIANRKKYIPFLFHMPLYLDRQLIWQVQKPN